MARPMVIIGTSFLITALGVSFFLEYSYVFVICFAAILAAALLLLKGKRRTKVVTISLSCLFAALCSMLACMAQFDYAAASNREVTIEGKISGKLLTESKMTRLTVDAKKEEHALTHVFVYLAGESELEIGDEIRIKGKTQPVNQDGFDTIEYYKNNNIQAVIFSSAERIELLGHSFSLGGMFQGIKASLCETMDRFVPTPYAGMLKAILLGEDSDLDRTIYLDAVQSGAVHIFVVSGLHIGILAGMLLSLLRLLRVKKKIAAVLAVFTVWFFVAVAGFFLPAVRAAIMVSAVLLATVTHRPADSVSSLLFAAVLLVGCDPAAILSASFLLSFGATLGVLLLSAPISEWLFLKLSAKGKSYKKIIRLFSVSVAAITGILPVTVVLFGGISLAAPFASLLILPVLPAVIGIGGLLLLLAPFGFIAEMLGAVEQGLLWYVRFLTKLFAEIKPLYIGLSYEMVPLLCVAGLVTIALAAIWLKKRRLCAMLTAIFTAGVFLLAPINQLCQREQVQVLTVTSYDGAAVIVQTGFTADLLLFGDSEHLCEKVRTVLQNHNIYNLSCAVILHNNIRKPSDEAALFTRYPPAQILTGEQDYNFGNTSKILTTGETDDTRDGLLTVQSLKGSLQARLGESGIALFTTQMQEAENANCEFLYYYGKSDKNIRQNKTKCVILLNENLWTKNRLQALFQKNKTVLRIQRKEELLCRK